jgi:predicted TPR repeat methyltransferase
MDKKVIKMENNPNNYDNCAIEYQWYGHEIIFGLLFEYLKKEQNLLDLGIGTGLSSSYFNQLGLKIYGVDISQEMLSLCKKKGLADDLKIMDIVNDPFPFEDNYFDYVISCGVFHFVEDLNHIFKKTRNVLKNGGIFSFTIKDTLTPDSGIVESFYEDAGVIIYSHSDKYVEKLSEEYKFRYLKKQKFLGENNPSLGKSDYFTAYVLKK